MQSLNRRQGYRWKVSAEKAFLSISGGFQAPRGAWIIGATGAIRSWQHPVAFTLHCSLNREQRQQRHADGSPQRAAQTHLKEADSEADEAEGSGQVEERIYAGAGVYRTLCSAASIPSGSTCFHCSVLFSLSLLWLELETLKQAASTDNRQRFDLFKVEEAWRVCLNGNLGWRTRLRRRGEEFMIWR